MLETKHSLLRPLVDLCFDQALYRLYGPQEAVEVELALAFYVESHSADQKSVQPGWRSGSELARYLREMPRC